MVGLILNIKSGPFSYLIIRAATPFPVLVLHSFNLVLAVQLTMVLLCLSCLPLNFGISLVEACTREGVIERSSPALRLRRFFFFLQA